MAKKNPISRDEVLAGLGGRHTKQANTTLALIESRTAHLVSQANLPPAFGLLESGKGAGSKAYLESIAMVRDQVARPRIQDIERFASHWAVLVPENPQIRATIANLMSERYTISFPDAPGICAALGLVSEAVQSAYASQFDATLDIIAVPEVPLRDSLRWRWTKLVKRFDALPPSWMAFMFTLIIGGVTLAVPISVASVGAIPSIILIIVFCLVSLVTIAAMAESVTRSGGIRYEGAFIGRVVGDYLGRASSVLLTLVLTVFSFGLLLIFYLGISSTLEGSTGLPTELWLFLLFGIGLYFLTRGSLNVTVAFSFLITIVNMTLLLIIGLIAIGQLNVDYLTYVDLPFLNDEPFNPALYSSIIGVIMGLFSAHMMVAVFGKLILDKDPSGKALVRGHPAGIVAVGLINIFWVIAVNGSIPPEDLLTETGTALVPLAANLGQPVGILGAVFVVLSMGLGFIHFSIALFNLARERLAPQRAKSLGRVGTFFVSLSPVILVFAIALWMSISGSGSFAGILGYLGVIVDSLMIGIIPVLLLLASRRKGELVPGVVYRFLGNRLLGALVLLFYLFILFFHGIVIWQSPLAKAAGILVGLLVIGLTVHMLRNRVFARRMVVELRDDRREGGQSVLSVVDSGELAVADVSLNYRGDRQEQGKANTTIRAFSQLNSLSFQLPQSETRELKLWVHQITQEGGAGDIAAKSTLNSREEQRELELSGSDNQVILPLDVPPGELEITLQSKPAGKLL